MKGLPSWYNHCCPYRVRAMMCWSTLNASFQQYFDMTWLTYSLVPRLSPRTTMMESRRHAGPAGIYRLDESTGVATNCAILDTA